MAYFSCSSGSDEGEAEQLSALFSVGQVDQQIRQAVQFCWMALPKEKRSVEEVERQIRRLVDRAIKDLREDREAFGRDSGS